MEFKLSQAFLVEVRNAKIHNEARELGLEFSWGEAVSVFLSWDFGEHMGMNHQSTGNTYKCALTSLP